MLQVHDLCTCSNIIFSQLTNSGDTNRTYGRGQLLFRQCRTTSSLDTEQKYMSTYDHLVIHTLIIHLYQSSTRMVLASIVYWQHTLEHTDTTSCFGDTRTCHAPDLQSLLLMAECNLQKNRKKIIITGQ